MSKSLPRRLRSAAPLASTSGMVTDRPLGAERSIGSGAGRAGGFIETPLSGRGRVRRWPVVEQERFGWLHTAAEGPALGDVAVLICAGLAWDCLQPHHSLRLLADEFAASGYPTLRFDYPGTCNSGDLPEGAETWAIWLRSVQQAADHLKALTGAGRVVFCGLRAGATLAMLAAAARTDAAGVILLAPVLRGRSYIQQLRIQAQLEGGASEVAPGGIGFHELAFSAETVATIGAVDLRTVAPPVGVRIGVFAQAPSALVTACAAAWQDAGADVACRDFAGLEPLLRIDVQAASPAPEFGPVLSWLGDAVPQQPYARRPAAPAGTLLTLAGCTETPVRFGAQGRLFGILCRPAEGSAATAVVILNTGRDPLSGIGRFGVDLARRLAAAGHASLRIDFAGLGDSTGAAGKENGLSTLFDDDRGADVAAALDWLEGQGYRRFVLQGLCSGAYHAFHAGVADSRVVALLLVNLPIFAWQAGADVMFVSHTQRSPLHYLRALLHWRVWGRLLGGRVNVARLLRAQLTRHVGRRIAGLSEAPPDPAGRGVAVLARRGARALFLFSPGDPGLDAMSQAFGPHCERLAGVPGCTFEVMEGLDHVLSGRHMRVRVAQRCIELVASVPTPAAVNGSGIIMHEGIDA